MVKTIHFVIKLVTTLTTCELPSLCVGIFCSHKTPQKSHACPMYLVMSGS